MKIDGIEKLRRLARWLRNFSLPLGLILSYHRVAELLSDPHALCVTPQHFTEHLEVLKKFFRPMPLGELAHNFWDNTLPNNAVVLTFDDGYADNLYNVNPLLQRYDFPATVFVTSGYIGYEREFWWDELDRLLLQCGTLPESLRLTINGRAYHWEVGEWAYYSGDTYRSWKFNEKKDPTARHSLYRSLYAILRCLPRDQQRNVLDGLSEWAGVQSLGRSTHRILSTDELLRLGKAKLIEIGSHTVTHPDLSFLNLADQCAEIQQSKSSLEQILGYSITSFAYPYGTYTKGTTTVVREAGFNCACSSFRDAIWPKTDYFQLPRLTVSDWDGEEFTKIIQCLNFPN